MEGLSYRPLPDAFEDLEQFIIAYTPAKAQDWFGIAQPMNENTKILHDVSFEAEAGRVTGTETRLFKKLVFYFIFFERS